jgi:hypothetical protein
MGLNTMDPVLDFGENVCLTLSAAGQLACPIQALWTFGTLAARLDEMKQQPVFTPDSQIQAYRSWLLMRCRQVWSPPDELIQDEKLLAMVGFWGEFHDLSLAELVFPLRWEGKISGSVNIASILDHLIRSKEAVPVTVSDATNMMMNRRHGWISPSLLMTRPLLVVCKLIHVLWSLRIRKTPLFVSNPNAVPLFHNFCLPMRSWLNLWMLSQSR